LADHSSKGVLTSVLIRLRNLRCEAAKGLTRTVEPLMMMMIPVTKFSTKLSSYIEAELKQNTSVCLQITINDS
jgi:hypothetical protein